MIKVGSDFSGVGAFNQALIRLGIPFKEIFACDMDKYARQTFIHNYGEPDYYPTNVYNREIPSEPLDIYMTSPPCQAFSLAGNRLGKEDQRGILFFNSHEFIKVNKPRFFIFENVKGLLSDDNGNTFNEWVNLLGGKSVNGLTVMFPYEDSVPYHLYWKVLNAKHHGVPQNRERVFLIGIRDDKDNTFRFPPEEYLKIKLKDVLQNDVDKNYYLSNKAIEKICNSKFNQEFKDENTDSIGCLTAGYYKIPADGNYIKVKSTTSKGYEEASEGDSINFSLPSSQTRRDRVGKAVAQTLDTGCNQGVICAAIRGRDSENGLQQQLELGSEITSNSITTVQKDNVILIGDYRSDEGFRWREDGNSPTLHTNLKDIDFSEKRGQQAVFINNNYRIRRLTPRECFRLMDFPDTFTWPVSDSQAYKQAGNSIVVNVLYKILKNLPL